LRRLLLSLFVAGWLWSVPLQAAAHEQAIGLTEVTLIAPDGQTLEACTVSDCRVEIAHRLSIHDAESTLAAILGARSDLSFDPEAQGKFETYVAGQFKLFQFEDRSELPLTLIGGERDRGYYWVYQEGVVPAGMAQLRVANQILMDAIPSQSNQVNLAP